MEAPSYSIASIASMEVSSSVPDRNAYINDIAHTSSVFNFDGLHLLLPDSLIECGVTEELLPMLTEQKFSDDQHRHLCKLLPSGWSLKTHKQQIQQSLSPNLGLKFGYNVSSDFCNKLRNGHYSDEGQCQQILKEAARRETDRCIMQQFQLKQLKLLLVRRKEILRQASTAQNRMCKPHYDVNFDLPSKTDELERKIRKRAYKRANAMILDCKSRSGENGWSSDDELIDDPTAYSDDEQDIEVQYVPKRSVLENMDLHEPHVLSTLEAMLKEQRQLKDKDPTHPTLDVSGITTSDIVQRSGCDQIAEKYGVGSETAKSRESTLSPNLASNILQHLPIKDEGFAETIAELVGMHSADSLLSFSVNPVKIE